MGNYEKPPYDPTKWYVEVLFQIHKPLFSFELDHWQEILREQFSVTLDSLYTEGIIFGIEAREHPTNNINQIQITAGSLKAHRLIRNIVQQTLSGFTTPPSPRTDLVYIDLWMREVDSIEDPDIISSFYGLESALRQKFDAQFRIQEGSIVLPTPPSGHIYYRICKITRPAGQAEIYQANITDIRDMAGAGSGLSPIIGGNIFLRDLADVSDDQADAFANMVNPSAINYIVTIDDLAALQLKDLSDVSDDEADAFNNMNSPTASNHIAVMQDIIDALAALQLKDLSDVSDDEADAFNNMVNPSASNHVATIDDITNALAGLQQSLTVGENVTAYLPLYLKNDGKLWKANASSATTALALFMSAEAKNADQLCKVYLSSQVITNVGWSWAIGGIVYLATSAGGLTQTKPITTGNIVFIVGVAISATKILFQPGICYIEVA